MIFTERRVYTIWQALSELGGLFLSLHTFLALFVKFCVIDQFFIDLLKSTFLMYSFKESHNNGQGDTDQEMQDKTGFQDYIKDEILSKRVPYRQKYANIWW